MDLVTMDAPYLRNSPNYQVPADNPFNISEFVVLDEISLVFEAGQAAKWCRNDTIGIGAAIELQLGRFEDCMVARQFGGFYEH